MSAHSARSFSWLIALLAILGGAVASGQATVLLKEALSREFSLHVGAVPTPEIREVVSREVSFHNGGVMEPLVPELASREISAVVTTDAPPTAITGLLVDFSPDGTAATLSWTAYDDMAEHDIMEYRIYVEDFPFTDVAALTPFLTVSLPVGTLSVSLTGLAAWQDHYFAVVPVDLLGGFDPAVDYAAGYVQGAELLTREFSIDNGGVREPAIGHLLSREMHVTVTTADVPVRIVPLNVTSTPLGDEVTLSWPEYNEMAQCDIAEYRVYAAEHPFADVTGMEPAATVPPGDQTVRITGLEPWRDCYFAVVAVDLLGGFDPVVVYAANYVLSQTLATREFALHNGGVVTPLMRDVAGREIHMLVPEPGVPDPVTGLGSGFTADTSTVAYKAVDLTWPNYDELAQVDVLGYRIYVAGAYFDDVSAMSPYQTIGGGVGGCTVGGLESNAIYYFAVVAEDAGGRFDPVVRAVSALTSPGGVSAVQDLAVVSGADSLTYTWNPPAEGVVFLKHYRVFFGGAAEPVVLPASAEIFVAEGLFPAHGYAFQIVAVDVFGNDAGSSSVFGATWLSNPAVAKKELDGAVRLAWNPVEPGDLLTGYAVYQSDAEFADVTGMVPVATTGQTRIVVSGLTNSATYHFAVVAVNLCDGYSPTVESIEVVPQPDVRGARVVAAAPYGPSVVGDGVEQVLQGFAVTFDDIMLAGSFEPADVTVTAPGRADVEVLAVTALSETAFAVSLADSVVAGIYAIRVGPEILDECGNPMDQNENGTNGEEDDAFSFEIVLSDPGLPVGMGDGLLAEYFATADKTGTGWRRRDAVVDHDWDAGAPFAELPVDHFSAVWTGELEVRFDGDYTFRALTEDGIRLWLDGVLRIDRWGGGDGEVQSAAVPLTRGRRPVRLEFVERTGTARIAWQWSCPFFAWQTVPRTQLISGLDHEDFAATPTVSPAGGTVTAATDIVLTTTTAGADVYYSLVELDPDQPDGWTRYESGVPIHLAADATVRAFAGMDGLNRSGVLVCPFELQETELSGTVWSDSDSDGIRDGGEPLLADRLLFLDADGNGVWTAGEVAVRSAADGSYCLRTPWGGLHRVRLALGQDERLSLPGGGASGYDVTTVAGEQIGNLGFGLVDAVPPNATFDTVVANALPAAFGGTVDDPVATVEVAFLGTTLAATNLGNGRWQVATAGFGAVVDGIYDIELLVADAFGNERTVAVPQAVTISTAPPTVLAVSPLSVEGRALARVEVLFDSLIAADSLQPADLSLTLPGTRLAVSATLVRLEEGGRLVVAQFPAQTANGSYVLAVGPAIQNVFSNPMAEAYEQELAVRLPDLAVEAVSVDPVVLQAGAAVVVSWTERNLGLLDAGGYWTTSFRLEWGAESISIGSVPRSGGLAAGQVIAVEHQLLLPSWVPAGDELRIRVEANSGRTPLEADWANNSAASGTLASPAALQLRLAAASVAENVGTVAGEVWRNGSLGEVLSVALTATRAGGVQVPESVEIVAGEASAGFALTVVDDALVTGSRSVTITATAAGAVPGQATLTVVEDDKVALELAAPDGTDVLEGEELAIRVARDDAAGLDEPLTISLSVSAPDQASVSATVVIPAGESEATFPVLALDDEEYEQVATIRVSASAAGCVGAELEIEVFDDDEPTLALHLERTACSEGDGAQAIAGVVTRSGLAGTDLRVKLEVDAPEALLVPSEVIIASGRDQTAFSIGAIDNDLLDGDRLVVLTASGLMKDCGCSAISRRSRQVSIVQETITVRDDDAPGLRLTADRTVAREGVADAFRFTLSRNTATDAELTVGLVADPAGEMHVPATVVLGVGEDSVTFSGDSLDDGVQDGTKTVLVRAEAEGLMAAEMVVTVTDLQLPDLVISQVSSDTEVVSGSTFSIGFTLVNQGQGPAQNGTGTDAEGWVQRVFLSSDPYIGDDQLVGDYRVAAVQPVGEEWAISQTISWPAPSVNGEYWVVVAADIGNEVAEILETNNTRISPRPLVVSASYDATVRTDFETGLAAPTLADVVPILLYGSAANHADGMPAVSAPVHIHIRVREYERVLLAITDRNGEFTSLFRPLPGEGGEYTIGACHPGDAVAPEQDSFTLMGMAAEPAKGSVSVPVGETVAAAFTLRNLSEVPLAGLAASLVGAPEYLHGQAQLAADELGGLGTVGLTCEFQADDPGALRSVPVTLRVTATEGAAVEIPLVVTVRPLKAILAVTSGEVYVGAARGERTLAQVTVENQGAVGTGAISVNLPAADWLSLGTANPMPSLAPGEHAALVLDLSPAADAELTLYRGHFVLAQEHGDSLRVPFEFRVVSDATGDLEVTTINQFYYYAEGAPTLPGAEVRILDGFTGEEVAQAVSDEQGVALFPGLPEGYYTVLAQAEKHRQHREIVFVAAGRVTAHLAYMVRQTVEITWTVEEVELEDRVRVVVETTFETNVPAPVVTVEPAIIDLGDLKTVGQVERLNMTISNHGLISAAGLKLEVGTHPFYSIEPLVTEFGDLPAMGSVTVPVVLRRIGDYSTIGTRSSVPCGVSIHVKFELCKSVEVVSVGTSNSDGDCGGGGGGGGGGGSGEGGSFGGGSIGGSGEAICACIIDADCPCVIPYLNAGLGCVINFIPGYDIPKCLYGGYNCAKDILSLNIGLTSLTGCAGAAIDCASAAGKSVPGLGQVIGGINCLSGIYDALKECGVVRTTAAQVAYTDLLSLLDGTEGHYQFFIELYGSPKWLDFASEARRDWDSSFVQATAEDSAEGFGITAKEAAVLLAKSAGPSIDLADIQAIIERCNNTVAYLENGWVSRADVPEGMSTNFIDMVALTAASESMNAARGYALSLGYDSYLAAVKAKLTTIVKMLNERPYVPVSSLRGVDGSGQCARVKLLLSQDVVLAHEGFEATLKIENAEDVELTSLSMEVTILDSEGNNASVLMALGEPVLAQFTALDGSGVLAAGATGTARWLIVPTAEAAPVTETTYYVGGFLGYAMGNSKVTVPLAPVEITVHPQPELHLEYYHQRDVFADDPWTDAVEPSLPYELAVLVRNTGAGDARSLRIISGKPQIVENEKGLLIDFQIIGREIDGESMTPALTAEFGDLPAGDSAVARWWMTSSLQGQFTEYKATLSHTSPLGDPRLSQVKGVAIFELIHCVEVGGALAFLTNDRRDELDLPDTIHTQNGDTLAVTEATDAVVTGTIAPNQLQVTLAVPAAAGWNYLRLRDGDPGGGAYVLADVRNAAGTSLPGRNYWQTDRTFELGGVRPIWEDNLHLLFASEGARAEETFTLVYRSADQVGPVVRGLRLAESAVVSQPQDSFVVEVSEPVDVASLAGEDFSLSRDGGAVAVPEVVATLLSSTRVSVAGFAAANGESGTYRLSVSGAGLQDVFGNSGTGEVTVEWTVCPDGPVPSGMALMGEALQNYPIDACEVSFTKDVDLASVDAVDVQLTRDGTGVPTVGLGFSLADATTVRVAGMQAVAADEGVYRLVFDASGITGGGRAGSGTIAVEWVLDRTGPVVTAIVPVESSLVADSGRTRAGLDSIRILWNEAVQSGTFPLGALRLLRGGVPVVWPGGVVLASEDGTTFVLSGISGITSDEGTYVLEVAKDGVFDEAGNAGVGSQSESWICDRTAPSPPANLRIAPDTGELGDDGVTTTTTMVLAGDLSEAGLGVRVWGVGNGVLDATVTGTEFQVPLTGLSGGSLPLRVVARDPSGNEAETAWTLFVDTVDLTVQLSLISASRDGVAGVLADFSAPLATGSFAIDDLTLRLDGEILDWRRDVEILPQGGSETAYEIRNLPVPIDAGLCELLLDLADVHKKSSGRSGAQTATISWWNRGALEELDLSPRSPLDPANVVVMSRTPTLVGSTPLDWLTVVAEDELGEELGRVEVLDGMIVLPLELARDGERVLTVRGIDGSGNETSQELACRVDTRAPEVLQATLERDAVGEVHAVRIAFSEAMDLQARIDDGSITDLVSFADNRRGGRAIPLAPGDFAWDGGGMVLSWLPANPQGLAPGTYEVAYAHEGITDIAGHALRAPEVAFQFVVARAEVLPGAPTVLNALGPEELLYRWDFDDGSPTVDGRSVDHDFAPNGDFDIWMTVRDGDSQLFRYVTNLVLGSGNQAPTTDLDILAEGSDAVARICPGERDAPLLRLARVLLADVDDRDLARVRVRLLDPVPGEEERVVAPEDLPAGIAAVYSEAEHVLELSGPASPAQFRDGLAGVQYHNGAEVPAAGDRFLAVVVDDGKTQTERTVTVQTRDAARLRVSPGWTLHAMPFVPEQASVASVFDDGARGSLIVGTVFAWNPARLRYVYVTEVIGQQGVWTRSQIEAPADTVPSAGFCERNNTAFADGWNLWGPAEEVSVAELRFEQPMVTSVWTWDVESQSYRKLADGEVLQRCVGYWVFMEPLR